MPKKKPVVLISSTNDADRRTNRPLNTLSPQLRSAAARCFIGYDVTITRSGDLAATAPLVAWVEGVGKQLAGEYGYQLIVTAGFLKHDLSNMQVIPLSTIRSIETVT